MFFQRIFTGHVLNLLQIQAISPLQIKTHQQGSWKQAELFSEIVLKGGTTIRHTSLMEEAMGAYTNSQRERIEKTKTDVQAQLDALTRCWLRFNTLSTTQIEKLLRASGLADIKDVQAMPETEINELAHAHIGKDYSYTNFNSLWIALIADQTPVEQVIAFLDDVRGRGYSFITNQP